MGAEATENRKLSDPDITRIKHTVLHLHNSRQSRGHGMHLP